MTAPVSAGTVRLWADAPALGFSVDLIQGSLQVGSHFAPPAPIVVHGRVFGGQRAADVYGNFGWSEIETAPPVLTRGVLLEVPALPGQERLLDGFEVAVAQVEGAR